MYFVVFNIIIHEKKIRVEKATFANDTRLNPTSPQDYILSLRLTIVYYPVSEFAINLRLAVIRGLV